MFDCSCCGPQLFGGPQPTVICQWCTLHANVSWMGVAFESSGLALFLETFQYSITTPALHHAIACVLIKKPATCIPMFAKTKTIIPQ